MTRQETVMDRGLWRTGAQVVRPLLLVPALATVLLAAGGAAANSITLRGAVALDAARDLTIADVAEVSGAQAEPASGVTLISAEELSKRLGGGAVGAARITLGDVRAAMARAGLSASRLALSGSACEVRLGGAGSAAPPRRTPAVPSADRAPVLASDLVARAGGLRAAVARSVVDSLGFPAETVRLAFDPRDAAWMTHADSAGGASAGARSVLARPLNTGAGSGSIVVEVRLVEHGRETAARTVGVTAEVRRPVLRLTRDLPRRTVVSSSDFEVTEEWVTPGAARASGGIDPHRAVGRAARSSLKAGTLLTPEVLVMPSAVRRNEFIDVWIYQGNVAVKARAMALKEGSVGDVIPARLDRHRAAFMVRIDGERRGVVVGGTEANTEGQEGEGLLRSPGGL